MSSDGALDTYASNLETLASCAVDSCDTELLKYYIDLLDSESSHTPLNHDATLLINLYVEDMFDKVGPIKLPCVSQWTGSYLKQKCSEYFNFPVEYQALLVNSVFVDDDQTLFSAGVRKTGDVLCMFLHKPNICTTKNEDNGTKSALLIAKEQLPKLDNIHQHKETNT